MRFPKSRIGLTAASLYLAASIFLIATQGLFGESFVAFKLGMPWSILTIIFLRVSEDNPFFIGSLYIRALAPIIVNATIFYWVGAAFQKLFFKKKTGQKNK